MVKAPTPVNGADVRCATGKLAFDIPLEAGPVQIEKTLIRSVWEATGGATNLETKGGSKTSGYERRDSFRRFGTSSWVPSIRFDPA